MKRSTGGRWTCHGCDKALRSEPLECEGRCDGVRFCPDCLHSCDRCGARPMCDRCASYESLRFGCEYCYENVCTECAGENCGYGFCCRQIACNRCVESWGCCDTCDEVSCDQCMPNCSRCRMPPRPPPPSRLQVLIWSYERLYSGHPLWISPGSPVGRVLNLLPILLLVLLTLYGSNTLPPLLATHWRQSSSEAKECFGWAIATITAALGCWVGVRKHRDSKEEQALLAKLAQHMTKRRPVSTTE